MAVENYAGFWVSPDGYLSNDELEHNAIGLFILFYRIHFSRKAICAMLGNMQAEAGINPARTEGYYPSTLPDNTDLSNFTLGAGIVQWTPANTTIVSFADNMGKMWYDGNAQFLRMKYEYDNNFQFIQVLVNGVYYNWQTFHNSDDDINDLTEAFARGYERATEQQIIQTLATRQYYARTWYTLFENFTPLPLSLMGKMFTRRKELKPRCQRI